MSAPTKIVELPLTKSERNHLDNVRRRDAQRARSEARRNAQNDRDAKLAAVNAEYGPKIEKLQKARREELKKVWDEWRATRAEASS